MRRRPGERQISGSDPGSEGVIEEISLERTPSGMGLSWWDRVLVAVAAVAIGGGLLIVGANAIGLMSDSPGPAQRSSAAAASASPRPSPTAPADPWVLTAATHGDDEGSVFSYECAPGGHAEAIYGLGIYADSSSVCTAAVHWGLITLEDGGTVTILMQGRVDTYIGARRNGIVSTARNDPSEGSFMFVSADEGSGPWSAGAVGYRDEMNKLFDYDCPPNGSPAPIWGSHVYTDDSSVCTSAVHSGLITFEAGGTVTIRIRPGRDEYPSTVRNGVVSRSWGPWDGSYVFVER